MIGESLKKNPPPLLKELDEIIEKRGSSAFMKTQVKAMNQFDGGHPFFIALAAPSMTGKTQMAFSISSKIPLYLINSKSNSQPIYFPFEPLSFDFLNCALTDNNKMLKSLLRDKDKEVITATDFVKLKDFKSKTLGLLSHLVDDAELYFSNPDAQKEYSHWLHYYRRDRVIDFKPMSINEFYLNANLNLLRDKYFIFIDEFAAESNLIFVRNLCRYLGISCVLASTNARVANLIGKSTISGSGGAPPGPWSVVFNKLPTLLPSQIDHKSSVFTKLIDLAGKTSTVEMKKMTKLASFLKQQCKVSRPGFSSMIFDSIEDVIDAHYASELLSKDLFVDDFFQFLIDELLIFIKNRKPKAFSSAVGKWSNMILLHGDCFDRTYSDSSSIRSTPSSSAYLIDSHFFNVRRPPKSLEETKPFLLMRRNEEEFPFYVPALENDQFAIQSYFDRDEELLMICCLKTKIKESPTCILSNPLPRELSRIENLKAKSLSGQLYENIAHS